MRESHTPSSGEPKTERVLRPSPSRYGTLPISCRLKVDGSVPPNMKDIGLQVEPLEFTVTNRTEYGKTTLTMRGLQKIRATARANKGEGNPLCDKTVELPVTIYPDAISIAKLADQLQLEVTGQGESVERSGKNTSNYKGNQTISLCVPYPYRDGKPPAPKIVWSGDNFSIDYKEEIARPYVQDRLKGPVTIKATITGTIQPEKRLLSYKATQTIVEKQTHSNGMVSYVHTSTLTISAQNLVADSFTGPESEMAMFSTSSLDGHLGDLKPIVSGKLTEQTTHYDEEGKVREDYGGSKSATIAGPVGGASAVFGVRWINPPSPYRSR